MSDQPNILFLQVDQLTARVLGAYGGNCRTPNLDRLAETGVVFETAYCNFPLCAPSRFSMATGRLCSEIGAYDNAAEMPASIPTYAHYLASAGYQTALSGKMHFIGPDQHHGFEKRLTADLYPADFSWVPNWGNEGKRDTNNSRGVLISGICERSVQIDYDEHVTAQAIQHLFDLARGSDSRPFFLQVSYTHPHEPYLCRKEYWDLYEDEDIPMPDVPALHSSRHDAHSIRLLTDFAMLDVTFSDEEIKRARHAYFGAVSYVDAMIGRILDVLEATSASDNTAIVFTSDHGEMLGERGMWFKKHFFEPSMHVPLIARLPGQRPGRVKTPVSLVDLLPTFMGIAEGTGWNCPVEPLDGSDLTVLVSKDDGHDRPVFAEYLAESTPGPIFMLRQGRHKLIWSKNDPPLLYDLEADPHERKNLAGEESHAQILAGLTEMIAKRWNDESLSARIRLSQKRRRKIIQSHGATGKPRWNHGEKEGDEVLWYRGQGSYNDWAFAYLPVRPEKPERENV